MFTIKREILISTERDKCLLNTYYEDVTQLTTFLKSTASWNNRHFFGNDHVVSVTCVYNLQTHTEVTLYNFEHKQILMLYFLG